MGVVPVHNPNVVSGNADARFLTSTILDAMALRAFKASNILFNSQFLQLQSLSSGESTRRFKIRGDSPEEAEHHVRGATIEGGTRINSYVDVSVDDDLIKALQVAWQDQQLSKFDELGPDMDECIRKLSEKIDKRAFRLIALGARTAATTNVHPGGNRVVRDDESVASAYDLSATGSDRFIDDLGQLARAMDEDNIPRDNNRHVFTTPYMLQVLLQSTDRIVNKDYADAGNFSIERRDIAVVEGFRLHLTNDRFPSTNITTDLSKYNGDFSLTENAGTPVALALYNAPNSRGLGMGGIGGVQAGGMRNVVYWDETNNTWLIKSQMLAGMGVIKPWLCGEVAVHDTD